MADTGPSTSKTAVSDNTDLEQEKNVFKYPEIPRKSVIGSKIVRKTNPPKKGPAKIPPKKGLAKFPPKRGPAKIPPKKGPAKIPPKKGPAKIPSKPTVPVTRQRKGTKLTVHQKCLLGEANLTVARGDVTTAERICLEIIRQTPLADEPYEAIGHMFETVFPKKSEQYQIISAHLFPKNADMWIKVAQNAEAAKNYKEAIECYTKAIRSRPRNAELHVKRIQLLELVGDKSMAMKSYVRLMNVLDDDKCNLIIEIAKKVARYYNSAKNYAKAVEAMDVPFKRCPHLMTPEMINIMLELLLTVGNYTYCLDIFLEHCNIEIEIDVEEDNKIKVVSYSMPENIHIDLRIKFTICLIKLKSYHLFTDLLNPLICDDNAEIIGDLYLDVAEALMAIDRPEDALKLLIPLLKSKNFSLAAVWLKHAECLIACDLTEQAIESYENVLKMAPQHTDVRYTLAGILLKYNKKQEALRILNQDPRELGIDAGILFRRIKLLRELGMYEEYWQLAELLFSRHCQKIRFPEEIKAVTLLERPSEKLARIRKMRAFREEPMDVAPAFDNSREPSIEEEYVLLREVVESCMHMGETVKMQHFAFMALSSSRLNQKYSELGLLAFFACILNKDTYHGYSIVREIILHHPCNNMVWNLFNLTLQRSDDSRHYKFMARMVRKHRTFWKSMNLEANNMMVVGNYNLAMNYYKLLFRAEPCPFYALLLGIAMLHIAGRKFEKEREIYINVAILVFLHYSTTRGKDALQEVYYNLGRMYHQFGIPHLAAHCYKMVLKTKHPLIDEYPNILSLKHEAAFNLHLICKNSDNLVEARNVLMEHIVV